MEQGVFVCVCVPACMSIFIIAPDFPAQVPNSVTFHALTPVILYILHTLPSFLGTTQIDCKSVVERSTSSVLLCIHQDSEKILNSEIVEERRIWKIMNARPFAFIG